VAAVERKSLADLVSSMINGKLRYALGELAALGRAAVVVEDRYSSVFKLDRVRPAVIADGLAELAVRWPSVSIVFAETRSLAEEWTYRYLAAAAVWAVDDLALAALLGDETKTVGPNDSGPSTAEVRSWARSAGSRCRTEVDSGPRSGRHGVRRARPERRSRLLLRGSASLRCDSRLCASLAMRVVSPMPRSDIGEKAPGVIGVVAGGCAVVGSST
jgi:hypothetical protein